MNIFLTIALIRIWFGHFIFIDAAFLQPSLFPKKIPPYIAFVRDSSIQQIPTVLKKYLVWKAGHSGDSSAVHDVVQRSGNSSFFKIIFK